MQAQAGVRLATSCPFACQSACSQKRQNRAKISAPCSGNQPNKTGVWPSNQCGLQMQHAASPQAMQDQKLTSNDLELAVQVHCPERHCANLCGSATRKAFMVCNVGHSPMTLSLPSKCSFPDDPLGLIGAVMEPNGVGLAAVCCAAAPGTSLCRAWGPLAASGLSLLAWRSPSVACLTEAAGMQPGQPCARPEHALLLYGQQPRL